MEGNEPRRRSWSRFRLATLFWITFAVACFFAGDYWHDELQSIGRRQSPVGQPLMVRTGQSTQLSLPTNVPKLAVDNPAIAMVRPVSATDLQVTGRTPGSTSLKVWDSAGNVTFYRIAVAK